MILNNLMSTKLISTNCEPDNATALLNDVHDLIENHLSVNTEEIESLCPSTDDLCADVEFDPIFTENALNFCESESAEQTAGVICSQILKRFDCENCPSYLLADFDRDEDAKSSVPKFPSIKFIETFTKIFDYSNQSIPLVASEKSLKKFIIDGFKKANKINELAMIGCVDHNEETINVLVELTVIYAIKVFCKNINDLLRGKIKELPPDPTPIQESARTFFAKKSVRKHTDIFRL